MPSAQFESKASVDVHTHIYLPTYVEMLRTRKAVPRVVDRNGQSRLLILPGKDEEDSPDAGRSFGSEYFDIGSKIRFMDNHGIALSVLSLANPWVDFLPPSEAVALSRIFNDDMEAVCAASGGRLRGFGVLPLKAPAAAAEELARISTLRHLRGVIIGTSGAGNGLHDPALEPVWAEASRGGHMMFVHPHYGLGNAAYEGTGHALFLALGFPFETSVAIARLILAGVLDRHPALKLLVAHAGGTLPYLAGRLDSCVGTERQIDFALNAAPSEYLKRMYFDSIGYHTPALLALIALVGHERIMFGTDHPFFPPRDATLDLAACLWPSPQENYAAIDGLPAEQQQAILNANARRIMAL